MANLNNPISADMRTKLNDPSALLHLSSRRDFFLSTGKGLISGAAALAAFSVLGERTADAQSGSADYSDVWSWADNNLNEQSWLDNQNITVAPHFNSINNGTFTADDIGAIRGAAYNMQGFAYNTGNPTFDACCQACVLYNVPSPGSASSVLFTNPTLDDVQWIYNQAQSRGYGYNWTVGQLDGALTVPNISTWDSSNPFYTLCTETCSSVFGNAVPHFLAASEAVRHDTLLSASDCSGLSAFAGVATATGVMFGIAARLQAGIGDLEGAGILAAAALIADALALAATLLHGYLC